MGKRALVLAGGGAKGSFQVGMLEELVCNRGLDFEILRGVSVGALNASFLAQAPLDPNPAKSLANLQAQVVALKDLWTRDITGDHSVYADRSGFAGMVAGADSLYSLEPLRRLVKQRILPGKLKKSGRDFAVGTVSLVSGEYQEWSPGQPDFIERIIASASIPVVFPFVTIGKDVLVDGGARNVTPLSSAFEAGPDEIYVLLTSRLVKVGGVFPTCGVQPTTFDQWDDNWLGTHVNGIDVLKRTVEILTDEIYLDDIRGALEWNEVVGRVNAVAAAAKSPGVQPAVATAVAALVNSVSKREVKISVLAPQEWYGAKNDATDFDPAKIRWAIQHGAGIAADPKRWLWP